jgi:hypothetical protein
MMAHLLTVLLLLAPPQAPAQKPVSIEGRVLRTGTTDPIPNVPVTLVKSGANSPNLTAAAAATLESLQRLVSDNPGLAQSTIDSLISSQEQALGLPAGSLQPGAQNTALTDAAGHFSFANQAPGKFNIRATREGFFGPSVNGSPSTSVSVTITVEADKPAPPADLYMVKGGVISGRVRDPNGQPASGITIAAHRVTFANGRPQWTVQLSKPTDDRGEYRIFWIGPGDYYVGTTPRTITTVPGLQDSWARTFFPGVTDPASASVIQIRDGSEVPSIDFTIQSLATPSVFKITGRGSNPLAVPNATTGALDRTLSNFILSPREPGILDSVNPPSVQNALSSNARPNGEFEIRNVRPGSYDLITYFITPVTPGPAPGAAAPGTTTPAAPPVPPPVRRYYIDRVRVDVRNSDVEGIQLEVRKGTEVKGRVVVQGSGSIQLDKIRLIFHSQDTIPDAFASIMGAVVVDASGEFTIPDVPAARLSLQVTGLPENAYVVDILQNGASIFDSAFTVGSEPVTGLRVEIGASGGIIEGTVENGDHKAAANATVVLVPPADHRANPMMYKTVQTDPSGHYSMKGVPPGQYTLFAWENVPSTAWMNSDFLAKYQNRGRAVVATGDASQSIQLNLIPDEINRR